MTSVDLPSGSSSLRLRGQRRSRWAGELRERRRRLVTYGLLAAAVVLMVNAVVGENGYLAGLRAQHEYNSVMAKYLELRRENQELKEHARQLRDDPAALEQAARHDLGLIRPGETLVIVKDVGAPRAQ
jgi:cell division protein FtsB